MAVRMGRWDCPCGTVNIGTDKFCRACGRPTTGKWYLLDGEPEMTDLEQLKLAAAGPNWVCRFCDSDNAAGNVFCTQCGGNSHGAPTRPVIEYGPGEAPSSDDEIIHSADPVHQTSTPPPAAAMATASPSSSFRRSDTVRRQTNTRVRPFSFGVLITPAILLMVLSAIAFVGYLGLRRYEVEAQIQRFDWSRTIHVDEYRTVREGAWSIPVGGRYVSDEQKVHHYIKVLDHYETKTRQVSAGSESYSCGTTNNGNGTFSDRTCTRTIYRSETYQDPVYRDDPVYATWYHYDIDKWVPSRQVQTSDDTRDDPEPHWGTLTLNCANTVQLGCEKENRREEHYFVLFKWQDGEEERAHTREEEHQDWRAYDQSTKYTLIFNGFGTLMNDPLRPE